MKKYLTLLIVLLSLSFRLIPTGLCAGEPQIKVEQVLQTTQSWDSSPYTSYPTGEPQVTVLRITIPPNTALHWHRHPIISVGYKLGGDSCPSMSGARLWMCCAGRGGTGMRSEALHRILLSDVLGESNSVGDKFRHRVLHRNLSGTFEEEDEDGGSC